MKGWQRIVVWELAALVLATACTSPDPELAAEKTADCCSSNEGLGCGEPEVEACVCAADPFCCEYGWDAACVIGVEDFDCAVCPEGAIDAALQEDGDGAR